MGESRVSDHSGGVYRLLLPETATATHPATLRLAGLCQRTGVVFLLAVMAVACAAPGESPAAVQPASPAGSPAVTADATHGATSAPTDEPVVTPLSASRPPAGPSGVPSAPAPAEGEFVNPVLAMDFPDPHVIEVDGTYHAYATTGHGHNIQHSVSRDMVSWEPPGEALPQLPEWSPGDTWAPEVAQTSDGFVMYYTLRASEFRRPGGQAAQCISYALSDAPGGPFEDPNDKPLVCQSKLGGSIDPHHFVDEDGTAYLVWKNDGNCCGQPTRMWLAQLSEDGTSLVGEPTDMGVTNDQVWEFNVIEAPSLLLHDGTYFLFYSGHLYDSGRYAVGYATAEDVRGPYQDAPENPILQSADPAAGPGHATIVRDADGEYWLYYHAWESGAVGYQSGGRRALWLDELRLEAGRPVVLGPDVGPQPAPTTDE